MFPLISESKGVGTGDQYFDCLQRKGLQINLLLLLLIIYPASLSILLKTIK